MKHTINAVVFGFGNIGKEIVRRIGKIPNWNVSAVVKRNGLFDSKGSPLGATDRKLCEYLKRADIGFVAIHADDRGETAKYYIEQCMKKDVPVVTCTKTVVANFYDELDLDKTGINATVGGGSQMLSFIKDHYCTLHEMELHMVLNGTLNYIIGKVSTGEYSLEEAISEAKRLNYAEPGKENVLEVVTKEILDTVIKSVIVARHGLSLHRIQMKDILLRPFGKIDLDRVVRESVDRRYIVSFRPADQVNEKDILGGFRYQIGSFIIDAGFKRISHDRFYKRLVPEGVGNAALMSGGENRGDVITQTQGPGAGAGPTVTTLLNEANKLVKLWPKK